MKTPNYPTEQYHLDNHMNQEMIVVVDFKDSKSNFNAILLDDTARGIFYKLTKTSKDICFMPHTAYNTLMLKGYKLPETEVKKESEEKK